MKTTNLFLVFLACTPDDPVIDSATKVESSSGEEVAPTSSSSSFSSSSTTSTTDVAPFCGDGFLQTGEECDDGNKNNDDACLNTCLHAICGDGEVFVGVETCDEFNLDTLTCDSNCTFPKCGDAHINPAIGEECDGEENCTIQCKWEGTLVYFSSTLFNPAIGGTENADFECQRLARNANLKGTFKAWLWTSTGGPGVDWPELKSPYIMPNGEIIAHDWAQFYLGTWNTPIDITENSIFFKDEDTEGKFSSVAWVGYHAEGIQSWPQDENCIDWTSNVALGGVQGTQESDLNWNGLGGAWGLNCDNTHHFICVRIPDEQGNK